MEDQLEASRLSVAAWAYPTRVLGPGRRFAFWLQGCPFSCPGCVAPDFQLTAPAHEIDAAELCAMILAAEHCEGLTVSGGEPMSQAEALAPLLETVRRESRLSVICYTGYSLAQLRRLAPARPALSRVLGAVDVLIDGPYEHALNDSRGLRGSRNQTVHHLTGRYRALDRYFTTAPRRQEIHRQPNGDLAVGLPTLERWRRVALDPTGGTWYVDDEDL